MNLRLSLLSLSATLLPLIGQNEPLPPELEKVMPLQPDQDQIIEEKKENKDARLRIPIGAVISSMSLPYYDKEHQQIALLAAKSMDVKGVDLIKDPLGDPKEVHHIDTFDITIWLFDKLGEISSEITIPHAIYYLKSSIINSTGTIFIKETNNQYAIRAQNGIFALETGEALLAGPINSRFTLSEKKDKTAMNLRPLLPTAAAIPLLIAAPPVIDPAHFENFDKMFSPETSPSSPPALDPDQLARFERLLHTPINISPLTPDETAAEADKRDQVLSDKMAAFLAGPGKETLISQLAVAPPAAKADPMDNFLVPGPQDISIRCDQGVYLDTSENQMAYFGNIEINGKGVEMTCNKDLKAFFAPAEKKEKAKNEPKKEGEEEGEEEEEDDDLLKNFKGLGELKQITANGKVRIEGINEDGQRFFLGGERALYEADPKNPNGPSTITLRGDKLGFLAGDPSDKEGKDPISQARSFSKDAWVIVNMIPTKDGEETNLTVQFSKGGWEFVHRAGEEEDKKEKAKKSN